MKLFLILRQAHQTIHSHEKDERMQYESERSWASIDCNPIENGVHESKCHWICYKEKRERGIKRVLELQSFSLNSHLSFNKKLSKEVLI
jgi:hypothetical protein